MQNKSMSNQYPDVDGNFGVHGGTYIAETLYPAIEQLSQSYQVAIKDSNFLAELDQILATYVGRPSPLYFANNLSNQYGCQIYLKREDLNHTGAHKINNAVGQIMLAKRLGKSRIIAETGAGQHGVATATVCAREGLECIIYMGAEDIERQSANVYRMRLLGAEVRSVNEGTKTLKDALNEALRDWITNVDNTFYVIGSVAGPHPYPQMVRDFNAVIGREAKQQLQTAINKLPDVVVACVGGGSNAIGIFHAFIENEQVKLIGVEAGGEGIETGKHAAPLSSNAPVGILHGMRTYVMQDNNGQISGTSSIAAGLDYPGVGPEHAWLKDIGRAEYVVATDQEALVAFADLCKYEGIIPALESSHALAHVKKIGTSLDKEAIVLVNLSGRGDKDLLTVAAVNQIKLN